MNANKIISVCHLTSAHARTDIRIYQKECICLSRNNYNVNLLVADNKGNVISDEGIRIIDVGKPKNRFTRFFTLTFRIFKVAISLKAQIYHFHDPELIFTGILLRILGKKVIYDIHEDYFTAIRQRPYLKNKVIALMIASSFRFVEKMTSFFFELILAERYYKEIFPKGELVLNYPIIKDAKLTRNPSPNNSGIKEFIYTGSLTIDRGALNYAEIIKHRNDIRIYCIGECPQDLANEMHRIAGKNSDNLIIVGNGYHVEYNVIREYYESRKWLAGLAIFPPTDHYRKKELTKFFEYMYYGIPIICSNFKYWEDLVGGHGVGFCLPPGDIGAFNKIIDLLIHDTSLHERISTKGLNLIRSRFNWNNEEVKLLNVYRKCLS